VILRIQESGSDIHAANAHYDYDKDCITKFRGHCNIQAMFVKNIHNACDLVADVYKRSHHMYGTQLMCTISIDHTTVYYSLAGSQ